MEAKSETAIIIKATTQDIKKDVINSHHGLPKRKRGPMQFVRVALYMLRKKSGKSSKSIHVDVAANDILKNLVGSMRPLHLQSDQSPPTCIEPVAVAPKPEPEIIEEVFTPPMSPCVSNETSSSSVASSVDSMSRYASAVNLEDLDKNNDSDDEEEEGHVYGNNGGDEMIDVKAEEFIARFYEQMRLQTLGY
ncbi:DUF761 domain-containing protein [Cephalotus follicularis]|uniref:DUF761 domain-containing protein n=1 Tax=Cephalotus follicularis TaxID=3775 RepID=A0A1Q3AN09_CEPFO|nr:DUF761 domain-containing protein [Cephalotus follicularis]